MVMIIGGAWQGKTAYARRIWPEIEFRQGKELNRQELIKTRGVLGFHEFIYKELLEGKDVHTLAEEITQKNPGLILVTQELGYGLVPADPFDRMYRELTGRICTRLAASSTCVIRIVCGCPVPIKGTLPDPA